MKKLLTILLTLSMLVSIVPAFAVSAAEEAPEITLDGDLSDWTGTHTLSVIGSGEFEGKKVTFYAFLGEDGLYLAADAYHATFSTTEGDW